MFGEKLVVKAASNFDDHYLLLEFCHRVFNEMILPSFKSGPILGFFSIQLSDAAPHHIQRRNALSHNLHLPKVFFFASVIALQKIMKNAVYFILKALFIFKIFKFFFLIISSCRKNDSKIGLISKFMTSQPG